MPSIEHVTVYGTRERRPDGPRSRPAIVAFFLYFFVYLLTGVSFLRERTGGHARAAHGDAGDPRRGRRAATRSASACSPRSRSRSCSPGRSARSQVPVDRAAARVLHRARDPGRRQPARRLPSSCSRWPWARSASGSSCRRSHAPSSRSSSSSRSCSCRSSCSRACCSRSSTPARRSSSRWSRSCRSAYAVDALRQVFIRGADLSVPALQVDLARPGGRGRPVRGRRLADDPPGRRVSGGRGRAGRGSADTRGRILDGGARVVRRARVRRRHGPRHRRTRRGRRRARPPLLRHQAAAVRGRDGASRSTSRVAVPRAPRRAARRRSGERFVRLRRRPVGPARGPAAADGPRPVGDHRPVAAGMMRQLLAEGPLLAIARATRPAGRRAPGERSRAPSSSASLLAPLRGRGRAARVDADRDAIVARPSGRRSSATWRATCGPTRRSGRASVRCSRHDPRSPPTRTPPRSPATRRRAARRAESPASRWPPPTPRDVRVVHAPGRVNLIGEHTDYNDGFVLPVAIDLGISIALVADRRPAAWS